jgi:hypothetical protein
LFAVLGRDELLLVRWGRCGRVQLLLSHDISGIAEFLIGRDERAGARPYRVLDFQSLDLVDYRLINSRAICSIKASKLPQENVQALYEGAHQDQFQIR